MTDAEIQQIQVPLPQFISAIIRASVAEAWKEHKKECLYPADLVIVEERVRQIELKGAALVGYMVGAGVFGGGTAAILIKGLFGS